MTDFKKCGGRGSWSLETVGLLLTQVRDHLGPGDELDGGPLRLGLGGQQGRGQQEECGAAHPSSNYSSVSWSLASVVLYDVVCVHWCRSSCPPPGHRPHWPVVPTPAAVASIHPTPGWHQTTTGKHSSLSICEAIQKGWCSKSKRPSSLCFIHLNKLSEIKTIMCICRNISGGNTRNDCKKVGNRGLIICKSKEFA